MKNEGRTPMPLIIIPHTEMVVMKSLSQTVFGLNWLLPVEIRSKL
jgi:hypothetical protein